MLWDFGRSFKVQNYSEARIYKLLSILKLLAERADFLLRAFQRRRELQGIIFLLSVGIIAIGTLYFEREILAEEVEGVEEKIESEIKVLKRDGNREAFNSQKVEDSCAKAGAPFSVAKNIANQIEKQVVDGATTEGIRDMVLGKLGNIEENGLKGGKATRRKKMNSPI